MDGTMEGIIIGVDYVNSTVEATIKKEYPEAEYSCIKDTHYINIDDTFFELVPVKLIGFKPYGIVFFEFV